MAVYATSDWHGYMSIYNQIKEYINPDDTVYVLGDSGDRGPQGWECIKACLADPQIIYLKGNHDDMTAKAILGDWDSRDLSFYNGGYETYASWEAEGADEAWGHKLIKRPYIITYTNEKGQNIVLTHAGYTPNHDPDEHECIWGRSHIFDEEYVNDYVMVHGHTPVRSIKAVPRDKWYQPYWYANSTKCDIDMGTYRSGKVCLLNLDTWNYKIFDVKE